MHRRLNMLISPPLVGGELIKMLNKSLKLIKKEGIENVWKRHAIFAEAIRIAVKNMNLELFTKCNHSNAVTSVKIPDSFTAKDLTNALKSNYDYIIAQGQAKLKGKIFRIGNMGKKTKTDIIVIVSALENCLKNLGHPFEFGKALLAVHTFLYQSL